MMKPANFFFSSSPLSLLVLLWLGNSASGQLVPTGASPPGAADHADRALAAIDLAIIAAECDIMDVSLDAVRRAVRNGPPVSSVDLGGLLGNAPNIRRRPSQINPIAQQAATSQMKLAKSLQRLQEVWLEHNMDPALAYATWKELVFPADRPSEAFAYSVEVPLSQSVSYSNVDFEFAEPKPTSCGASSLVHWAQLADQLDNLRQEVAKRKAFPGAATTALLVDVLLAHDETSPVSDAEAICERLTSEAKWLVDSPDAELLFGHVWRLLDRLPPTSPLRQKLVDAVFLAMKTHPQWPANKWLQFLVAKQLRDAIEQGDSQAFRRMADVAMSRFDNIRVGNQDYVTSREAELYGEAARRAFQAGQIQLGTECLRTQCLLVTTSNRGRSQFDSLLDPTQVVGQKLLAMKPQERYALLNSLVWDIPALGLAQCSRYNLNEHIPALFLSPVPGDVERMPPSRQVAAEGALSVSLLEWVMRDALALGREAEIRSRIENLQKSSSDDARLCELVMDLAHNQPLNLAALLKTSEDSTPPSLTPVLGDGSEVIPLDISVIKYALNQAEFRSAGEALLQERIGAAIEKHQDVALTWLRKLQFEGESEKPEKRITHHALKHWVVCDETSQGVYISGQVPPSTWLRRSEAAWGHEFGPDMSYLFLRYPIEGEITIAFRSKDGAYEEGGATFGGLMIDYLCRRNTLRIAGVGNRNMSYVESSDMNRDAFTDCRWQRQGNRLIVHVGNSGFTQELSGISTAFPFFGLTSCHCSATTFDSVKIDGDVTVPRRVDMLSPTLLGWSARFKGQSLPNVTLLAGNDPYSETNDDKIQFGWQIVDGVLESVKPKPTGGQNADSSAGSGTRDVARREALLQYLRPLCDGEEISLEFYYEPESFAVAPAIGRIAILLSEPVVHLHWITSDSGGHWTGIDDQNRLTDPNAEQLKPLRLRENDWNQIVVRLDGETVTLRINGEDVYRRRWEVEAGRNFGLFHDPREYQVRTRNIQLSGDWPESLPENLFETTSQVN